MSMDALKEMRAKLDSQEAKSGNSGAISRTPKQLMLEAPEAVRVAGEETHLRWVGIRDPQKAQSRIMEGYEAVPESDGGRTLGGSLKLMRISREAYESRVTSERKLHQTRLTAHKTEMENLAENLARTLRDNHSINIDASRLLVSE